MLFRRSWVQIPGGSRNFSVDLFLSISAKTLTAVRKRKKKRGKTMHTKESTSTSSSPSGSELDVGTARQVYYQQRGKVPGLYIRRGCTRSSVSWIPIAPSPVSSRTRARTKR